MPKLTFDPLYVDMCRMFDDLDIDEGVSMHLLTNVDLHIQRRLRAAMGDDTVLRTVSTEVKSDEFYMRDSERADASPYLKTLNL